MLWMDAKIERLIELYRSFEFLYNPKQLLHCIFVVCDVFPLETSSNFVATRAAFRRWIPARVSGKCVVGISSIAFTTVIIVIIILVSPSTQTQARVE